MKTAIILGSTGLVGRQLLDQLLEDHRFDGVKTFVRRTSGKTHPRLDEHVVDFESMADWKNKLQGDILFSTLGTTLKTAGSKEAQYRVDFEYQFEVARAAAANGVKDYVLVSSVGADAASRNFYLRMKGKLDQDVQALPFKHIRILRPSILSGKREESRPGERFGIVLMNLLAPIPGLRRYRPIPVTTVAQAMRHALEDQPDLRYRVYALDAVFELAEIIQTS